MADLTLTVEVRERTGKGGAREARRNGMIPGVLYGGGQDPVAINLKNNEVVKGLNNGKLLGHMIELDHEGKKQSVICQDIQFHPVTDIPEHMDLYRVDAKQVISVEVSVHFVGEEKSPGLKKGGTLNVVRHEVELNVPAGKIPEFLEADVSALEIGDNVKISDINLPEGASPTITDRDFTIATIASRGGAVESDDGEEEAEGEETEE
ncbi:50S ribosomal protein L25/general stress protein Ctc [Ponticaulis sp.]|uniref:50S ribosomal protein L25/general stress protein Ctc n=1 Tax=Ponticaulis sp. TaxID=2020902 RepID=UPI000B6B458F|nr:50S ribosomal protein L25/general stress protein Ctc [Ponticaulis sp.]MAJ09172.1 50S ribosomal protein L25/general stress protein Ctc [Ponticaulis sp.]MDF1678975.1 50S ribosomal protein L25/general stress protein Ctc [Ponticaulis sp.]RPG16956.1 MAG: 50S ribosomal protein L25/general stress protein Ctc [Hyphomonadaceae bacterium TMED125]HBJ92460.1 50S ribosomal protein L25 [Hyphomonadaceae bacterium]|tara:strand:- start:6522 stop:7142 length:621 start_codon:yes stop_codon:yes gene_type:complete